MKTLRVARTTREALGLDPVLGPRGRLPTGDLRSVRKLAAAINKASPSRSPTVHAGEIVALALLHEVQHELIARHARLVDPNAVQVAALAAEERVGGRNLSRLLRLQAGQFGPERSRPSGVESLVLLSLALDNPAVDPLHPVIDPADLATDPDLPPALEAAEAALAGKQSLGPGGETLLELLRAPARHSPTSLAGQLRWVREHLMHLLDPGLAARLIAGEDLLTEEARAIHQRFGGGGPPDEGEAPDLTGLDAEPSRFSPDRDWMPRVVLLAKSTYVWLDQLSRMYGRPLATLDAIPDEELDAIAARGVTGLWLIGLWQRSRASAGIKQLRGNPDAVASAYSLDDYRIADDLGGEAAWVNLRDRAAARGIRLASDMVPNHLGLDSRWMMEHPERFLDLAEPPFPAYTFGGPNVSDDDRVEIRIEDGYWDGTDAAVVFERLDRASGERRYVYHGNDGTSFPWNDTAQLDFLRADVREAVIQAILDVARHFPIIRFDAAMVLARRHVQRLWWPLPGEAGAIPSRSAHTMTRAAFEKAMPREFWREVVDRVAVEAPDTLLLAEAFWMLEGYFVRTLGMHRVYNSAFMHMLRDEKNGEYRSVVKDTLAFDPEILKRYVNFMTNPDEETAIEQFGTGDKYFGVATLLATLPGLPMIGHGQIEGFREKYGMEFRRARHEELPDDALVAHTDRVIAPLLRRRSRFAEVADFLLFDVVADDGSVEQDVLAYSNGRGEERSLIVYHNRFTSTAGWIRESVPFAVKQPDDSKVLVQRTLAEGLRLTGGDGRFLAVRDSRAGLEFLRSTSELTERGLRVELGAYECLVFEDFREVHDGVDAPWSRLAAQIGHGGVPSLDEALLDLVLEPVHDELHVRLAATLAADPRGRPDIAAVRLLQDTDGTEDADRERFDRQRLGRALERGGLDQDAVERVRLALGLMLPSRVADAGGLVDAWLADPAARDYLGVHAWDGAEWLDGEALGRLLDWAVALDPEPKAAATLTRQIRTAAERAGYRVDRLHETLEPVGASTGGRGRLQSTKAPPAPDRQTRSPRDPAPRR